jgi:hypothetical protein
MLLDHRKVAHVAVGDRALDWLPPILKEPFFSTPAAAPVERCLRSPSSSI